MTYREAISNLGQARRFGMKLGLEPMRALANALGDPQKDLRFLHFAGTNGKGSTAAFCESILRAAGFRVGLYTSPHLVSVRERFQIDRVPISETDFATGLDAVLGAVAAAQIDPPTFFELTTALALWHFARQEVDWVVWETGLGGRLDATNIVDPAVCVITNIGLEHQEYLGSTLEQIASEKAGIIKRGVPVICGVEPGPALEVVRKRASDEGCSFQSVGRELEPLAWRGGKQIARLEGREDVLGLSGAHQVRNAACAVAATRQLAWLMGRDNWEHVEIAAITEAHIARGLAETTWPGRFDVISETPLVVLDGAHNPSGVEALVATWNGFSSARKNGGDKNHQSANLIFACAQGKDIAEMARLLRPLANRVSLVRLASDRGVDPATLAPHFNGLACTLYNSVADLWRSILSSEKASVHLATGSLFLVGEMLAQRHGLAEQYELNERLEVNTTTAKI